MNIAILSRHPSIYSTKRLLEAAKARGHEARIINHLHCYMNITSEEPTVHYRDEVLDDFDAIVPRVGASVTFYGTAVVRQFETMGVYSLNGSLAISRSRDKLRAMQILSKRGVGLPSTGFAHSMKRSKELIKLIGGAPLVVKLLEGTQGRGVVLAETSKAAQSVIEAFKGLNANLLVQEFIKEAGGSDIRCIVLGDKVVAAMKRQGAEGEFRSNVHLGGKVTPVKISPEERAAAVKASRALGLKFAGVDLLRSTRGPLVMEVNSSPGLQGIESATKKDIASLVIQFLEKNYEPGKKRKRVES